MAVERQKTLLLVDDEAIVAMAEKMALEKYGYNVITTLSGEEAVAMVEKTPAIDLILMDINLGAGMDGTKAAAIILRQHDLPVVFLSSHMEPDVVAKTEKITSYGYVVKDSSITVLDASIKMAFKLFQAKKQEMEKESRIEAALEALKVAEETYRNIFLNAQTGLFRTEIKTGLLLDANDCVARFIGYEDREKLLEKPFNIAARYVDINDRERMISLLKEHGQFKNFEAPFKRNDGSIILMRFAAKVVPEKGWVEGVSEDITKEKAIEKTLRENEEMYRSILNASPDGIAIADIEGRILMASPAVLTLFGYEREDNMRGHLFRDFIVPEDHELAAANIALMFQGTMTGPGKYRGLRAGGGAFDIEVNAEFIRDAHGQPTRMVFVVRDISERKQAETELKESKDRYENFISQISDGVYRLELNEPMPLTLPVEEQIDYLYRHMFIAECNPSFIEMYGAKEPKDVLGKTLMDFHGGSDNPVNCQVLRDFIQCGYKTRNVITEEIDIHGNKKYFNNNTIGIIKNNQLIRMWGTQTDISKRRQTEEALQESEERFRTLYENSPLGLYRTTPDGRIHLANPALIRMLGYSSLAELAKVDLQRSGFTPSHSRARFIESIEENSEVSGLEYTWKRKDGSSVLVRESARAIRDAQGKTLYYEGIVEDISARKQVEQALRESEERYRTLVQNASDLVYWTDKTGNFTYVNKAAIHISGYEEGELIGKLFTFLIRPDMRVRALKFYAIQMGKRISNTYFEIPLIRKDGREVWLGQNAQLIIADGQVTGFQAVARDITKRKRAEDEIQRQLAEKEILLKEVHHRIKNNIASIGGLISLRLQSITNPEAIAVLKDAGSRVDSMRLLYDKLLLTEDYEDLSVKNYLDDLIDTIIAIFPDKAKIIIKKRITDFALDSKQLFPLGIIINELLTNIMKYAFIKRKTGQIEITLAQAEKHVTLTIQDNGVGLPAGFDIDASKGFGLMLVKMLSQQLGGSFAMKKAKGTRCTVEFDI